jgi:hypothetical protein
MPGQTLDIKIGPARQIYGPLRTGALIKNNDSNNAVWISSAPSVTPGNGIKLTPLGYARWIADNQQMYGCVDLGVATPVSITVSDDIDEATDPVATGAAVAAQLLLTGVPNVFQGDILFNSTLANGADTGFITVSKYASLIVTFFNNDLAHSGAVEIFDNFTGTSIRLSHNDLNAVTYTWLVPIYSASSIKVIAHNGGGLCGLKLIGTNRIIDRIKPYGNGYDAMTVPRKFAAAGLACTNAVPIKIPVADGGDDLTNFDRQVFVRISNTTAVGSFGWQYVDEFNGNTKRQVYFASAVAIGGIVEKIVAHPIVACEPFFLPTATSAQTFSLDVIQA